MRKNVIKGFSMMDEVDISANATSSTVNVLNLDKASIYIDWAGSSPVGELTVEAKNGENSPWYALDFGVTIDVTGNTGDHLIILNEMPFEQLRIQYASTSGSGTISAYITAKQVGG